MFELKPIKKNIRVEPWDLARSSVYKAVQKDALIPIASNIHTITISSLKPAYAMRFYVAANR